MAIFTRVEIITRMYDNGMIPLYYSKNVADCKAIVHAAANAGVKAFEFTNRGDFALDVFKEIVLYVREHNLDIALGVGSIIDEATCAMYLQYGADFIVSPIINEQMARMCNRKKVLWVPGCGTLTEISTAESYGAEIVKIFPAMAVGGPGFIKAIKGPSPWTSVMPTGGVSPTEENLTGWFSAGAALVGMGSQLIKKDLIAKQDFKTLEENIKKALNLVAKIRNKV